MILFLDIISPIPEFAVIEDNKFIFSSKLITSKYPKLSDNIISRYSKMNNKLDLDKKLKAIIITTGPGSYTSLRVGISFVLGLSFSYNVKIAGISLKDLMCYENNKKYLGIYLMSANNQKFICYKSNKKNFNYIKLEDRKIFDSKIFNKNTLLYYNHIPLDLSSLNIKQKKYEIKKNILKNLKLIKYNHSSILKPIYISNNKILN
tara:strand:- start:1062 stop:1676 length:615 start_codon:yes stop_codon:yes gene_type:complete